MVEKEEYEMFIYVDDEYQKLNSDTYIENPADFTGYATEDYVTSELGSYYTSSVVDGKLADKADKNTVKNLQEQLDNLANIGLNQTVVESKDDLPNKGEANVIYFVFNTTGEGDNTYEEYIYITSKETYELIGSGNTSLDHSEFLTKVKLSEETRKNINLTKFTNLCNKVLDNELTEDELQCIRASKEFFNTLLYSIVDAILIMNGVDNNVLLDTKVIRNLLEKVDYIDALQDDFGYDFENDEDSLYEFFNALVTMVYENTGSSSTDLSNYYTKTQVDNLIGDINTYLGT